MPFLGSTAVRFATGSDLGDASVAVAALEPGSGWGSCAATVVEEGGVSGRKVAVEQADSVDLIAATATGPDGPVLTLVSADGRGVSVTPQPAFDPTTPLFAVELTEARLADDPLGAETVDRLAAIGALLAAAEAVGAAGRLLDDACAYAAERRQFGRTIGSFQALRHVLADMYVRQASSWSSVLYAAAALDEGAEEAGRTASIAKAYVSRAAREVAHGAIQVFGGIAITAEHPAHRYLRRIMAREQQFGDASHHERSLGRALAESLVVSHVN